MTAPLLFIVTGNRGAGKTSFCTGIVLAAKKAGWRVAGLLSRAVFTGSQRTAINVEDILTGQIQQLAVRSEDQPTQGSRLWKFDEGTLAWGNTVLRTSVPCDLLVIDELGPLEFEVHSGWQEGLAAIDSRQFAIAVVVVRAELLGDALLRWGEANIIEIDTPEDSAEKAQTLANQLF